MCNQQNASLKILEESVNITLDKYVPLKKRYVRANQSPFMNKRLSKEMRKRSRLKSKFLNTKSDIDRKTYNKQCNYVVDLLKNAKKIFYSNLDTTFVTDNRVLWKTVELFLSGKATKHSKINLVENNDIISRKNRIAKKIQSILYKYPNMPVLSSYRNQSIDLCRKSIDWFPYESNTGT